MNIKKQTFDVSFHCYYANTPEPTRHFQSLTVMEIPKWIEAYKFTHPACKSISFKIWFTDTEN